MLDAAKLVLFAIAALVIVATMLPMVRRPYWWVRMFDFPRPQVTVLAMAVLVLFGIVNIGVETASRWEWITLGLLAIAVGVQVKEMIPYTRFGTEQALDASAEVASSNRRIRLVVSNVLMENRDIERWSRVVLSAEADVIALVETDVWWAEQGEGALGDEYPYSVTIPQDDTYGMCVFSKLPITQQEVRHLMEPEVPSLFLTLELPSRESLRLTVLHPRPPRPDIQQDSQLRDAELVRAARDVATFDEPTIVAGDLNDVAWSYTTNLFQELSGFLDPRIGRGLYSTFHADHWWLRYPLDHVFHSDDLALVELRRLGNVGSDHFPMLIELAIDPSRRAIQDTPSAEAEDREAAREMVDEAQEFKAEETPKERQERVEEDV
ncbi:MAG: endonuclease/exonuclease/phosphatase family protein [Rubricoccaceae bacterium]